MAKIAMVDLVEMNLYSGNHQLSPEASDKIPIYAINMIFYAN